MAKRLRPSEVGPIKAISSGLLPINFAGLLLIVVALVLFVLEAKYPTHGILGVGGVLAMVLGALFLINSPLTGMGVSLGAALGVAIPCAVIIIILMRLVLRSRTWKLSTGKEELIGEVGEITEAVEPPGGFGMVFVHGELWRAAARGGEEIPGGANQEARSRGAGSRERVAQGVARSPNIRSPGAGNGTGDNVLETRLGKADPDDRW